MNTPLNSGNREGFIIVISLTLMLVMTTMGIGLYFSSKQSAELVGSNVTKSDSFYSAETCIAEARLWLKVQAISGAPCKTVAAGTICNTVTSAQMSKWTIAAESQIFKNRSQNQSYQCTIALLGSVAYDGGEGVGFDIGEGSGYSAGATNTKYLYRIRSQGSLNDQSGLNSFLSEVEVIDSMIF
jgi:Tfp pilus assembly protein PilX